MLTQGRRIRLRRKERKPMSRETEWQQLQEIREEILAIYGEMDACRELQKKLETLQEEKKHPAPPTVSLQPENTAGALQQSFDEENRRRILASRAPETAMRLGGAVLLGAVSVLLALELFGNRALLIDSASIAALGETGSSGKVMLLVAHILVSLAVLCGVGRRRTDGKRHVLLTVLTAMVAVGYLFMIGLLHAWAYAALIAVCGGLLLAANGGIKRMRQRAAQAPALTAQQKQQWEAARQADERAKEQNAQRQATAQKDWEAARQQRLPEIEREMQTYGQQFAARRRQLDDHMRRLEGMDALCEEDKNLQTVELLIRLMETRRADSVKEALQEYDKLMANRQLLEIEKQKLEAQLRRAAEERADRQQQLAETRRHREEMEYLARDSARSRAQMVDQLNSIGNILYYDLHF